MRDAARLLGKRPAALLGACLITLLLGAVDLTLPRVGTAGDQTATNTAARSTAASYFPIVGTTRLAGVVGSTVFAARTSEPQIFGLTPEGSGARLRVWRVPAGSTPLVRPLIDIHIPGFSSVFAVGSAGSGTARPAVLTAVIRGDQLDTKLITVGTHPTIAARSSIPVGRLADGLTLQAVSASPWPRIGDVVLTASANNRGRVVLSLYRGRTGSAGLADQLVVPYALPPKQFRVTFLCFPDAASVGCQVMWISRRPGQSDRLAVLGLSSRSHSWRWQFGGESTLRDNPALIFQTGVDQSGAEQWYAIDPTNGREATLSFAAVKTTLIRSL